MNDVGRISPINTPLQRGATRLGAFVNRFNGFDTPSRGVTPLKRGVNERNAILRGEGLKFPRLLP